MRALFACVIALLVTSLLTVGCGAKGDPRAPGCKGSFVEVSQKSIEATVDYETSGDCSDADCQGFQGFFCRIYLAAGGTCTIRATSGDNDLTPCTFRVKDPGCDKWVKGDVEFVPPMGVTALACSSKVEPLVGCQGAECPCGHRPPAPPECL